MSATAERVARNASYSLLGNAAALVAGTISSVVLARLLGPPSLGVFALVLSVGAVLGMIVALGIPHAATKYVAEYVGRGDDRTAGIVLGALARFEVAMALVASLAALAMAPVLERWFDAPGFAAAFRIAVIGLLPGVLATLGTAGLQGFQDFRRTTLISIATTAFIFCATVGVVAAGGGVSGAVGAAAATAVLGAVLSWRALRRHVAVPLFGPALPPMARVKLRRYVPAVSAVLAMDTVVWQRSEVFFLGGFWTPREVAWYAVSFAVAATVMGLLPRALAIVLAPVASGMHGAADGAGMAALFRTGSRYLTILAAPVVVGGAVLAHPLLTTVYGTEYAPAASIFPLMLVAAGVGAVGSVTGGIQHGMERQDLVLKVAVGATVVDLVLDVALIPAWGLAGAAVANAAAQIGAVAAGVVITSRLVGVRFPAGDCLRAVAAAGVAGGAAFGSYAAVGGPGGLVVALVAGAVTYPAALVVIRAVHPEDLERLGGLRDMLPFPLRRGYGGLLNVAGRWAG